MIRAQATAERRRSSPDVELLYLDTDVAVGTAPSLFMVLWRVRTTASGVSKVGKLFETFSARHPEEIALFTIVENHAKAPEPDAREPLALLMREASQRVVISAIVYEQTGFLAAAFRGVVTSLCLIARQAFMHRMFGDVDSAAGWMEFAGHTPCFRAQAIQTAVATFRFMVNMRGR